MEDTVPTPSPNGVRDDPDGGEGKQERNEDEELKLLAVVEDMVLIAAGDVVSKPGDIGHRRHSIPVGGPRATRPVHPLQ